MNLKALLMAPLCIVVCSPTPAAQDTQSHAAQPPLQQPVADSADAVVHAVRALDSLGYYQYVVLRFERAAGVFRIALAPDPARYPTLRGGGGRVDVDSLTGRARVVERSR
jgi:hypothetical protein